MPAAAGGMMLALALRLPGLQTWPAWTDETGEVAAALAIAFDGERPLVHNDSYRGPLWAYLLAFCLRLAGPHPWLPRAFAAAIGVLTVGTAAFLASRLAGRRAAWPTALLAATAFAPVTFFSHIAWSNHLTPLAVAAALLVTAWALGWPMPEAGRSLSTAVAAAESPTIGRRRGPWSVGRCLLAGLAWGLALQTHPSALPALAGLAAWLVWRRLRGAARSPEPDPDPGSVAIEVGRSLHLPDDRALARAFGGVLLGLSLGLAPLLVHNTLAYLRDDRMASVEEATAEDQPINRDLGPARLAGNLLGLAGQLGRAAAAGPPWEPGDPRPTTLTRLTDALRPAAAALAALLLLGALAWSARRPALALLVWPAAASLLLLPLINRSYLNLYDARYLGSLLLLAQVAAGARWAAARPTDPEAGGGPGSGRSGTRRSVGIAGARAWGRGLALAFLAAWPLLAQAAYAQRALAAGRDNRALQEGLAAIVRDRAREAERGGRVESGLGPVLIDKGLRDLDLGGGGDPARAFELLLRLSGRPVEQVRADTLHWYLSESAGPLWLLWAEEGPATADWRVRVLSRGRAWAALRLERPTLP